MAAHVAGTAGPERQRIAGRERLADHRHVGAGHEVEHGPPIRVRERPEVLESAADRHRRPPVRPHRQRHVGVDRCPGVLASSVGDLHPVAVHAPDRPVAHRVGRAGQQRNERSPVRAVLGLHAERVGDRRVDVDIGAQCVDLASRRARPVDHQRRVAERLELRDRRFAPDVAALVVAGFTGRASVAEVVAVIGAHDHRGVVPQVLGVELVENRAEMVVDHRQLGAVVGADLAGLAFGQLARRGAADDVRRPDEAPRLELLGCQRIVVVHRRPRLGRVERLVGVELVDEEHPPVVRLRCMAQPRRGGRHRPGAGEVLFGAEPRPAVVVVAAAERVVGDPHLVAQVPATVGGVRDQRPTAGLDRRGAVGTRVDVGLPRIALVAADVVPAGEVDVVVLAARLEQVRVVRHEHRGDVGPPECRRDRFLPQLDRPPRLPEEVEGPDEDVVARRHARQRPGDVGGERRRPQCEPIEVRRRELGATVRAEHVPVERVEQDDDDVLRSGRDARLGHPAMIGGTVGRAISGPARCRSASEGLGTEADDDVVDHHVLPTAGG